MQGCAQSEPSHDRDARCSRRRGCRTTLGVWERLLVPVEPAAPSAGQGRGGGRGPSSPGRSQERPGQDAEGGAARVKLRAPESDASPRSHVEKETAAGVPPTLHGLCLPTPRRRGSPKSVDPVTGGLRSRAPSGALDLDDRVHRGDCSPRVKVAVAAPLAAGGRSARLEWRKQDDLADDHRIASPRRCRHRADAAGEGRGIGSGSRSSPLPMYRWSRGRSAHGPRAGVGQRDIAGGVDLPGRGGGPVRPGAEADPGVRDADAESAVGGTGSTDAALFLR